MPGDSSSEAAARWLQPTGAAIGLVEEGTYTEEHLVLRQGDLWVMYTDGVVEATNREGRPFEAARLAEVVAGVRRAPPGEVVRAITQAVEDFLAGPEPADDITLVSREWIDIRASRGSSSREAGVGRREEILALRRITA